MTRQLLVPKMPVKVRIRKGGPYQGRALSWLACDLEVPGDFTVIELVELIKGAKDPSLVYRHSCHHGSCGTCAMRVNGVERLTCITGIAEVVTPGGTLQLEPLANLPWLADLANDPSPMMALLERLGPGHVRPEGNERQPVLPDEGDGTETRLFMRFADCIECGACLSACPVARPENGYIGPAPLVAAHEAWVHQMEPGGGIADLLTMLNGPRGAWQCHQAFECTRVCPAQVDVGAAIMSLRQMLLKGQIPPRGGRPLG